MNDDVAALSRTVLLCRDYVDPRVSDIGIVEAFRQFTISVAADTANLKSASGQSALISFVSLVSRMGIQIRLEIPELPIVGHQPPLDGVRLRQGLEDLCADLIPGTNTASTGTPVLAFALGDTPMHCPSSVQSWRLTGGDWYGSISPGRERGNRWNGSWPIGALSSSALAAAEVFKTVVRDLPLVDEYNSRFLKALQATRWDFGSEIPIRGGVDLGEVDVISGGAIVQAALFALFRIPGIACDSRIFDDDFTALSNLNRNSLTRRRDVKRAKVEVIRMLPPPGFAIDTFQQRFNAESVGNLRRGRTLVGVDDIPSRWQIQRATHGWLGVSGTSHFDVSSSSHDGIEPCSGCLHHIDDPMPADPIPTVSFVSFWAGLALAVRVLRSALGHGYGNSRQHLWLATLRMDNALGLWFPVAPRLDCPVDCSASRQFRLKKGTCAA